MNNSATERKKLRASSVGETAVRRQDIFIQQNICLATSIQKDFRILTKRIVTPTPNDDDDDDDDDDDVDNNDCKSNKNRSSTLVPLSPSTTHILCVLGLK
jgi:hypothetical protein